MGFVNLGLAELSRVKDRAVYLDSSASLGTSVLYNLKEYHTSCYILIHFPAIAFSLFV